MPHLFLCIGGGRVKKDNIVKLGIGFATGRRSFQRILKTSIYNWQESGLSDSERVQLNLFVAYDLRYQNTKSTDYTNVREDLLGLLADTCFIGKDMVQEEIDYLLSKNIINKKEAAMFFGSGYASKRNAILYFAIKKGMDYLIFLDDDEYPMAVTNSQSSVLWGGQNVMGIHLQHIKDVDITNGHHCGYISPVPYIEYNQTMAEETFRTFIEAISNDIINWDTIHAVMENGGVTYADKNILISNKAQVVAQVHHTKFISGSNLCINLTDPLRVCPFYNPPGARGEDTFLSTGLLERKVLRVPCYTFHDGFSTYNHIMDGVLPIRLKYMKADFEPIITRFYNACIGWVRYKPLLLYITDQEHYEEKIEEMRERIAATLPSICAYFGRDDFGNIAKELEHYHKNVKKHYRQFQETQQIWEKISEFLIGRDPEQR